MKYSSNWQKYTTLTASIFLTITVFADPSLAMNTKRIQGFKSSAFLKKFLHNKSDFLLAQVPASCCQVIARTGLNVSVHSYVRTILVFLHLYWMEKHKLQIT